MILDSQINELLSEVEVDNPKRIDLGLERIQNFLNEIGNPEKKIKSPVIVSGSCGKLSFLKFYQKILNHSGLTTNCYTSPHLINWRERYMYKNKLISNERLAAVISEVKLLQGKLSINLTLFEFLTVIFFYEAQNIEVDKNLLEIGLGGSLDAVNVAQADLSVINLIHFDHKEWLGSKISQIAEAKAGIIREKKPVVIGRQEFPEALEVIKNKAREMDAPTYFFQEDWNIEEKNNNIVIYESNKNKLEFEFLNPARFQIFNFGMALKAAELTNKINIKQFIEAKVYDQVSLPGRLQKLDVNAFKGVNQETEIWIDGGHQVCNSKVVNESLSRLTVKKLFLIVGFMNTKEYVKIVENFNVDAIRTLSIPGEQNSVPAEKLKDELKHICSDVQSSTNFIEALTELSQKDSNARILVTGSLYLMGSILSNLKK